MRPIADREIAAAPLPAATRLLMNHGPGSSMFLSSPSGTLLAEGTPVLDDHDGGVSIGADATTGGRRLAARVGRLLAACKLQGLANPTVVGALPFDSDRPVRLFLARSIERAGPLNPVAVPRARKPLLSDHRATMVPSPEHYARAVQQVLARLESAQCEKVVLSRMLELSSSRPIDVRHVLRNLLRQNPSDHVFAVDLCGAHPDARRCGSDRSGGPRTLVGASPELLVSRSGLRVVANPLAGSAARSADPEEDSRRASGLFASDKDRREHAVVVQAIATSLRPYCRSLEVPSAPSLIHTRAMWHLSSRITGELADPATSSLTLAAAVHPTAAVCGLPTAQARAAIRELEPFDRGFFTGMVGWCDANGDGEWVVTIRCAEIEEQRMRLYAGAGIVTGSRPQNELAETTAKFRTMLDALGIGQLRLVA